MLEQEYIEEEFMFNWDDWVDVTLVEDSDELVRWIVVLDNDDDDDDDVNVERLIFVVVIEVEEVRSVKFQGEIPL